MNEQCSYITADDVKNVCPYIEHLPSTDGHLFARIAASRWFDGIICARIGLPDARINPSISFQVKRALSYRAAFEILYSQITPQTEENAYERMAVKFNRLAVAEVESMTIKVSVNSFSPIMLNLGVINRGRDA